MTKAIVLLLVLTFGSAAANIMSVGHRPSVAEVRAGERAEVAADRQARIVALRAHADDCTPATAHELARLLVQDGQFHEARAFAGVYEWRCGEDRVVRNWGNAPTPRPRP